MILEYAQLLSTAHSVLDGQPEKVAYITSKGKPRTKTVYRITDGHVSNDDIYTATHINHPSAKWVRESSGNYRWLHTTARMLCYEYTRRYGRRHKTEDVIDKLSPLPKNILNAPLTTLPLAMPEEYHHENPVEAYRRYYREGKASICKWTKLNNTPDWFIAKE